VAAYDHMSLLELINITGRINSYSTLTQVSTDMGDRLQVFVIDQAFQANSAWPRLLHGRAKWALAMVMATAREKWRVLHNSRPCCQKCCHYHCMLIEPAIWPTWAVC